MKVKTLKELKENYEEGKKYVESKGGVWRCGDYYRNSFNRAGSAYKKALLTKECEENKNDIVEKFLENWRKEAHKFYTTANIKDVKVKRIAQIVDGVQSGIIDINKILDGEVKNKRMSFYSKINDRTGNIIKADLYIGNDGNINGTIKGEKRTVTIETILAGGYNIQCLHYRVLIK